MHDMLAPSAETVVVATNPEPAATTLGSAVRLGLTKPGDRGVIVEVRTGAANADRGVDVDELHRRLLEFGFVEGAQVEVLHEGAIWRDPIAVRLDDMRIALRRRDAENVWIVLDPR